ncbi:hypothetical protein [Algoriphagus aquimarinus]|uniref:Outer membrane protein beta-barrel domain-containing protein n=1 Tax=Algoriphagus aquimarinus TaxID=237018 RepID=A0A1I1BFI2_9BACT|nr:hypothetical protein [Algoriphagus aquimarinus]SFB49109.1 hypothetical protein SAMN04489723_11376 [Algoriphagus aquimarinus]|tara:strand:- start:178084 stop:178617 length:534 start_codon:yes stop_codon:yes gene_type:complete
MKKLILSLTLMVVGFATYAQTTRDIEDINEDNSWLKLGINLGAPVGDIGNYSSFAFGLDVAGQFMRTDNFGLGVVSGYTQYFAKNDVVGAENFGAIPLGLMLRYYPEPSGFFVGTDVGYTFLTGDVISDGGFYIRPQVGYHNYDWNIFAFYNQVFTSDPAADIQTIGVAATYNIRFK